MSNKNKNKNNNICVTNLCQNFVKLLSNSVEQFCLFITPSRHRSSLQSSLWSFILLSINSSIQSFIKQKLGFPILVLLTLSQGVENYRHPQNLFWDLKETAGKLSRRIFLPTTSKPAVHLQRHHWQPSVLNHFP